MSRLTVRNFENETCCAVGGCIAYEDCYECPGFQDILAKLAHYEDLEEKCIEETTFGFATLLRKWKEFQEDIAQWLEWRELAKQGRLVVLPCKVGEMVYFPSERFPAEIDGIVINENSIYFQWTQYDRGYELTEVWDSGEFHIDEIGKTVFLTREEAEAALEGAE